MAGVDTEAQSAGESFTILDIEFMRDGFVFHTLIASFIRLPDELDEWEQWTQKHCKQVSAPCV